MNTEQRMLQKDYEFYIQGLRDIVLALWENKSFYPVDTYNTYRLVLHRYIDDIEKIIEQTEEAWDDR